MILAIATAIKRQMKQTNAKRITIDIFILTSLQVQS
jgi:hypothetical protein